MQDLAGFVIHVAMCVVGVVLCVAIAVLCMVVVVLDVVVCACGFVCACSHASVCVCEPQQNPKRVTFASSNMPKSALYIQIRSLIYVLK